MVTTGKVLYALAVVAYWYGMGEVSPSGYGLQIVIAASALFLLCQTFLLGVEYAKRRPTCQK